MLLYANGFVQYRFHQQRFGGEYNIIEFDIGPWPLRLAVEREPLREVEVGVGRDVVKADLEVSLQRILVGRPELKYFEAGMDLRLSNDEEESFRIFQGRILDQYLAMSSEFKFHLVDANQPIEVQQSLVREVVAARIDLGSFVGPIPSERL